MRNINLAAEPEMGGEANTPENCKRADMFVGEMYVLWAVQ